MVADGPLMDTDSMTSGYSVPWARKSAPWISRAASSKTAMNSRPMIFRFFSGSVTPASRSRKRFARVHRPERHVEAALEERLDLLALAGAQHAVVDEDAGAAGPRWRGG